MPPTEPRLLAAMERLGKVRTDARHDAVPAIRELVAAVRELLVEKTTDTGGYLRGMVNINVDANRYYGVIVHAERGGRKDRLPPPHSHTDEYGREVLVLAEDAQLVMVARDRAGNFKERPATDADLRADDLGPIMRAVDYALTQHLANVERGIERYENISDLAGKLRAVLQGAA